MELPKKILPILIFLSTICALPLLADSPKIIMEKVVAKLRAQSLTNHSFGFYQQVRVRKFKRDFVSVNKEEHRLYRTIWVKDKSYSQLIKFNGEPLDAVQRAKESRRRSEFMKSSERSCKTGGSAIQRDVKNTEWWNIYHRYDFALEPADASAAFVILFNPKAQVFPSKTRIERVLQHIRGKVWIDEDFNILKAQVTLLEPVDFGFGLLARIEKMTATYTQQKFQELWLPASLQTTYQARIALLKNQRQELQVRWTEPYLRTSPKTASIIAPGF